MFEEFNVGDITYSVEWRIIIFDGIETNYEVNDIGFIRNRITKRILKPWIDKDGYYHVSITVNGKLRHRGVHRFVAIAFIPNPDNLPEVNHKNGKKWDNTLINLEWVTTRENIIHAFRTGLKSTVRGEANSLSTYTEKQIREVCSMLEQGISNIAISRKTGVDRKYITDIKKGRRWSHVSDEYMIDDIVYTKIMRDSIFARIALGKLPSDIIEDLQIPDEDFCDNDIIPTDDIVPASTTIPFGS